MEEINNILVIGNGFDLHHGLPTKYTDFINKIKEIRSKSNQDNVYDKRIMEYSHDNPFVDYFISRYEMGDNWIDFEKELERIVEIFSKIYSNVDNISKHNNVSLLAASECGLNKQQEDMLDCFYKYYYITSYFPNKGNGEEELGINFQKTYMYEDGSINKSKHISSIIDDLNKLIYALHVYLKRYADLINVKRISSQIANINPKYIINFNYTNTCEKYGVHSKDITYIHGSVNSEPCNMVLGTEDTDETDLRFVYFKKYFQCIQKRTDLLDLSKFKIYQGEGEQYGEPPMKNHVHFYGHSLSKTDGDIIEQIIENADKCIIYYLNQEDYEDKVINLIEILGKGKAVQMIHDREVEFVEIEDDEVSK